MDPMQNRRGSIDPILELEDGGSGASGFQLPSARLRRNGWHRGSCRPGPTGQLQLLCCCLLVLLLLLAASIALLVTRQDSCYPESGCGTSGCSAESDRECETVGCVRQAAQMLTYMDAAVGPCQNFYQHACGGFRESHPRGQQLRYSISDMLTDYNRDRLQQLLEQLPENMAQSAVGKARVFYQSCVHARSRGINYGMDMVRLVEAMGGMRAFGSWRPEGWSFNRVFRNTRHDHHLQLLFQMSLSGRHRLDLTVPEYFWYAESGNSSRQLFRRSVRRVLKLLQQQQMYAQLSESGVSPSVCDGACLEQVVDDIELVDADISRLDETTHSLDSELLILDAYVLGSDLRDEVSVAELGRLASQIDWPALLKTMYGESLDTARLNVSIPSRRFISGISAVIEGTPPRRMQHYLMWGVIRQYVSVLGPRFSWLPRDLSVSTAGPQGAQETASCVDTLQRYMLRAVQGVFIHGHLGSARLAAAERLVQHVRRELNDSFGWMSAASSQRARQLLHNISTVFGHYDEVADETALDRYYSSLSLSEHSLFNNTLQLNRFRAGELAAVRWDADTQPWRRVDPVVVRLFYDHPTTELNIQYGALQVPWFHHQLPEHINAAALGSIVLSELAAAFLPGAGGGFTARFWDSDTLAAARAFRHCLQANFLGFSPGQQTLPRRTPGHAAVTQKLLAEQLAFTLARRLHQRLTQTTRQPRLPGVSSTTAQQMFYLAFAQSRCENARPTRQGQGQGRGRGWQQEDIVNRLVYSDADFQRAFSCRSVPERYYGQQTCQLLPLLQTSSSPSTAAPGKHPY